MAGKRATIPEALKRAVLMEAGYRCAVPTCRNILAIDLHHIVQVSADGGNELANLVALCPTCHALYHRGTISQDAIYAYKGVLVALGHAFDQASIDGLLFLYGLDPIMTDEQSPDIWLGPHSLPMTSDGVLHFSRLIGAGLATFQRLFQSYPANGVPLTNYAVELTPKGRMLIEAWMEGNREAVQRALGEPTDESAP
jgi:hypothetical protein